LTETFTQTSHEPYDRHYYILHLTGGGHSVWDDYEGLRDHWFLNRGWGMSHIEVRDRKPAKAKSKAKGF
jgi:hypothetical protein